MYNRYVPRGDGTYTCKKLPDPTRSKEPIYEEAEECTEYEPKPKFSPKATRPASGSFLRQLLGKDFDTGDLIVILLLLLMAGDSEQERGTALLTIALYFMM